MSTRPNIFRQEAIDYHSGSQDTGEPIRLDPRWLRYSYWSIILLTLVGGTFAAFLSVDRLSRGPALVKPSVARIMTDTDGVIVRWLVRRGEHVWQAQELAELESQTGERRLIRAPEAGTIQAVLVPPQSLVSKGQPLATLTEPDRELQVVAALSGNYAAEIRAKTPEWMSLTIPGQRQIRVAVDSVEPDLIPRCGLRERSDLAALEKDAAQTVVVLHGHFVGVTPDFSIQPVLGRVAVIVGRRRVWDRALGR